MNVLIGCEFSGIVREAFKERGHNAWSCDLYWSEIPGQHIQANLVDVLEKTVPLGKWDLFIAHPPCTYLCNSGVQHLDYKRDDWKKRWKQMEEAISFFNYLRIQDIPKICIENPILHRYARKSIGWYDQKIQPYWFGDTVSKQTCLWLENLPHLQPTNIVQPTTSVHYMNGWVDRSRTFPGIARAMAEQWG